MQNSKIEQLLLFLQDDPEDSFTLYALALEYDKIESEKATYYYDILLKNHPNYLATYYHAAKYFEKSNRESAKSIYQKGITIAREQAKYKTQQELQNAYSMLLSEEEDVND